MPKKVAKKVAKKTSAKKAPKKAPKKVRKAAVSPMAHLLAPVTKGTLLAEARGLGRTYAVVTFGLGNLAADANELLAAKEDLVDLQKRRFPVSPHLFKRISLLLEPLTPLVVSASESSAAAKERTAKADAARTRLLEIRTELAQLAEAMGLADDCFKLGLRKSDRINPVVQRLREVLVHARTHQHALPDPERVEQLISEGEALVDEHTIVRVERDEKKGAASFDVDLANRYQRLLWDAMVHLSRVGLAAYPNDPVREPRYRLDHVYGDRPAKKAPVPPSA